MSEKKERKKKQEQQDQRATVVPIGTSWSANGWSPWMTADEAAEYLGLSSRKAVYERVLRGQLPAHRFGRNLRFHREELDEAVKGDTPIARALRSDH